MTGAVIVGECGDEDDVLRELRHMLGWRIGDNGSWIAGVMYTDGPLLEAVCCYIMVKCRTTQV